MADQFGALQLPVPVVTPSGSLGDPALDAISSYLSAVITRDCGQAWTVLVGAGQPIIQTVSTTNPENGAFQKEDMPILFVWRPADGDLSEQWTDDLIRVTTKLSLLWITRPADQPRRAVRTPMGNAVAAAIRRALYVGRDPAWVDPLDPDLDARSLGSVLMTRAGLSEWPELITCKPQSIMIQLDESEARPYWAVGGSIEIAEVLVQDPAGGLNDPASQFAPTRGPSKVDVTSTAGALTLESKIPTT